MRNIHKGYLWIIILLLVLSNAVTIYFLVKNTNSPDTPADFELLSPQIAWLNVDEFLEYQHSMIVAYGQLKEQITFKVTELRPKGNYGIYFEDLTTGAWIGINEKEKFYPFSLLKVPVMMAVLKKVQDEDLSLEKRLYIHPEYIEHNSGSLYLKGAGYEPTIKELMGYLIKESDNTAVLTLSNELLTMDDIVRANLAIGLPVEDATSEAPLLSTKDYSNIFRSLYYSTYLRRRFSELALILMTETDYNSQLPAGVPKDIKVAHKIGFYIEEGYYHDCGIVYYEPNPYLLCVMTEGMTKAEADKFISSISKTVYSYVSKR
jgi:beta-lactamase class A